MLLATALVLLYVHQETAVLRVSYSIEKKERELARLSEEYKTIHYQVARLRSPSFLNRQMKEHALNLTTPKVIEMVKVPMQKISVSPAQVNAPVKSSFFSWFGSIKEAQAKTSK